MSSAVRFKRILMRSLIAFNSIASLIGNDAQMTVFFTVYFNVCLS